MSLCCQEQLGSLMLQVGSEQAQPDARERALTKLRISQHNPCASRQPLAVHWQQHMHTWLPLPVPCARSKGLCCQRGCCCMAGTVHELPADQVPSLCWLKPFLGSSPGGILSQILLRASSTCCPEHRAGDVNPFPGILVSQEDFGESCFSLLSVSPGDKLLTAFIKCCNSTSAVGWWQML